MIKNKKAISGIIVTILLVLLVIVAVGILWAFILPLLEGTIDNMDLQNYCLQNEIIIERATIDSSGGDASLLIKRTRGRDTIQGYQVYKEGNLTAKFTEETLEKIPNTGQTVSITVGFIAPDDNLYVVFYHNKEEKARTSCPPSQVVRVQRI